MTHSTLVLVVDALAVFRLTWLICQDAITASVRDAISRTDRGRVFITCPWCVSIWVAAGVVVLQHYWPHAWWYAACGLAFSAVAGLIAGRA